MSLKISPENLPFRLKYAPEYWDYVTRFAKWYGEPFKNTDDLSKGLSTITGHRDKFQTLAEQANRLVPEIVQERNLFDEQGYSNGNKAREFTCTIETLICELYSCLDGLRTSIHSIYRDVQGVQKKSTEKLFRKAAEEKYGDGFPSEINTFLKTAYENWYLDLRRIRVELTHGRVGSCSMQDDQKISYIHQGLGSQERAFVIDDIIDWVNRHENHVNLLLNTICKFWFEQLEPREVLEPCGLYQGRGLVRAIEITEPINQDSGLCGFRHAFEEEPGWACPLRHTCGAYERVGSN
ncbi:MAG: hypothetical protein RLZZ04_4497 [Cyanobacteriota bacterium]|jgi:hypothetical protein